MGNSTILSTILRRARRLICWNSTLRNIWIQEYFLYLLMLLQKETTQPIQCLLMIIWWFWASKRKRLWRKSGWVRSMRWIRVALKLVGSSLWSSMIPSLWSLFRTSAKRCFTVLRFCLRRPKTTLRSKRSTLTDFIRQLLHCVYLCKLIWGLGEGEVVGIGRVEFINSYFIYKLLLLIYCFSK